MRWLCFTVVLLVMSPFADSAEKEKRRRSSRHDAQAKLLEKLDALEKRVMKLEALAKASGEKRTDSASHPKSKGQPYQPRVKRPATELPKHAAPKKPTLRSELANPPLTRGPGPKRGGTLPPGFSTPSLRPPSRGPAIPPLPNPQLPPMAERAPGDRGSVRPPLADPQNPAPTPPRGYRPPEPPNGKRGHLVPPSNRVVPPRPAQPTPNAPSQIPPFAVPPSTVPHGPTPPSLNPPASRNPPPPAGRGWQRFEFNGESFYIIPVDEMERRR